MAVITISGEPGCRTREVAQLTAQRLGCQHVSAGRLAGLLEEDFAEAGELPPQAWPDAVASVLIRQAVEAHLVAGFDGAELLFPGFPSLLRVRLQAPLNRRIGNTMLDDRLDRPAARQRLREQDKEARAARKARFGRATPDPVTFDLILNAANLDAANMAEIIETTVRGMGLLEHGLLSPAAEATTQFRFRFRLSKLGLHPKGQARLKRAQFSHPSEEIFANLLDFYRIPWEYEPRSFAIQWDRDGRPIEAFTPDFYLPESDLYVELTTMKQSLVTKKNRKIKLIRQLYPEINLQIYYQKDLQDLVMKYGLATEPVQA